jgi:hypothetical protein
MRIRPFLGNSDRGDVESELGRIPILSGLVNYDETSVVIGLIKLEKRSIPLRPSPTASASSS